MINIVPFEATAVGSYFPLSGILEEMKKSIVNIKNEDNKCLYYCLYAYFMYKSTLRCTPAATA